MYLISCLFYCFRICVHHVCDEERHEPQLTFDTDGKVICMKYLNGLLFAGMEDGRLAIYRRDQGTPFFVMLSGKKNMKNYLLKTFEYTHSFVFLADGAWDICQPMIEDLNTKPITCLHAMGQEMWAASGGNIYKMNLRPQPDGDIIVEKVVQHF